MSMFSIRKFATAGLILSFAAPMVPVSSSLAQADETLGKVTLEIGLGKILTGQEQQALPKHVFANGAGLPDGEGSSLEGARIYQASCASCHGAKGQGGTALELVGDKESLKTEYPDRGVAAFWPNAPTLYEYIDRAMPPDSPNHFTDTQLYALVAYILELNQLLEPGMTINKTSLSKMVLPNNEGFRTIGR